MGSAELIVALDLPQEKLALEMADLLFQEVDFFKVGLELFVAAGSSIILRLKERNLRVFLDLKLHDIPNQVANAIKAATVMDVDLLTVHTLGGREMMTVAANAAVGSGTKLLGVTVLTSHNIATLEEIGIDSPLDVQVKRLARLAKETGLDGVVASGVEAAGLRTAMGPDFLIVTPGIRPAGADAGDQKRAVTPADAIASGADYLVVGRPIIAASDPVAAARAVKAEMRQAANAGTGKKGFNRS